MYVKAWRNQWLQMRHWQIVHLFYKMELQMNTVKDGGINYALGKLLLSKDIEVRDPEQGIRWLELSAEQGNPHAHYRLGKEYLKGEVVEKDTHLGIQSQLQLQMDVPFPEERGFTSRPSLRAEAAVQDIGESGM